MCVLRIEPRTHERAVSVQTTELFIQFLYFSLIIICLDAFYVLQGLNNGIFKNITVGT